MKQQSGELTLPDHSRAPGDRLFWQSWEPDANPKGLVILVHGYAEHSGRYDHVSEHLVDSGYAVFAVDHWGHGKSTGTPGFVPEFQVFHDGVSQLIDRARENYVDLPMVLVGHSMGGLISATYLLANSSKFAACVLSGPAIKAAEEPSAFVKFISKFLARFFPKAGVLALDSNGVSRDPEVVAKYLADPLVYNGKMGARLALEMLNSMSWIQAEAEKISLPMLMLHGENDTLAAADGSRLLDSKISSQDKKLIIYPGLYHEIFNEPEREQVLADMTDWLDQRVMAGT